MPAKISSAQFAEAPGWSLDAAIERELRVQRQEILDLKEKMAGMVRLPHDPPPIPFVVFAAPMKTSSQLLFYDKLKLPCFYMNLSGLIFVGTPF